MSEGRKCRWALESQQGGDQRHWRGKAEKASGCSLPIPKGVWERASKPALPIGSSPSTREKQGMWRFGCMCSARFRKHHWGLLLNCLKTFYCDELWRWALSVIPENTRGNPGYSRIIGFNMQFLKHETSVSWTILNPLLTSKSQCLLPFMCVKALHRWSAEGF